MKTPPDGCAAAGPHFKPATRSHGDGGERPVGDWGNIFTPEVENHVTLIDIVDDVISLYDAEDNIVGRTLVLHRYEKKEDHGDGHHHAHLRDAGEGRGVRVACGVVEQEVNAKTAIVELSGSSSITLTQVPTPKSSF